MRTGWFKIYRQIENEDWYRKKPFDEAHAFLDLNLIAAYKSSEGVNRGDITISLRKLSERWGWSRDKITHFLLILAKNGYVKKRVIEYPTSFPAKNRPKNPPAFCFYLSQKPKSDRPPFRPDFKPKTSPFIRNKDDINQSSLIEKEKTESQNAQALEAERLAQEERNEADDDDEDYVWSYYTEDGELK